ncbi:MAG: HAD family phosphatase [Clostridia bacterium]|nr:HAD family phosphatase [Clostridia bacterium]
MNKRYDGCLICTDMDGTLLTTDKVISRENAEAIKRFQQGGGLFTVATGRYWDFVNDYRDVFVPNTYVISLNGCVISEYSSGEFIRWCEMDRSCFDEAEYVFESCPQLTMLLVNTTRGFVPIKRGETEKLNEIEINGENRFYKMTYMSLPGEELTEETRSFFVPFSKGRYNCERSWPGGMEYYPLEGGKHNAVTWLKQHTRSDKLICIGDYENDVSMLECADMGVAVSNALDCVRAAADVTVCSNDENAIAALIERL